MNEDIDGIPGPCQPIGCDHGYHLPGCTFAEVDLPIAEHRKHPMAHCEDCPFGADSSVPVLGMGPKGQVKVAVVGEAPGFQEDTVGRPFVGVSGQILNEVLRNNDLNRDEMWVTNAVACRPPENATPSQAAIDACRPRLLNELLHAGPEYTVATGAVAAKALGASGAMAKLRVGPPRNAEFVGDDGSGVEWVFRTKVIDTWHPAYAARLPDALPSIDLDISKIVKGTTASSWHEPLVTVVDDHKTAFDALLDLEELPGPFAVDIETGIDKDDADIHADQRPLLCIGVGYAPGKVVVFGKSLMQEKEFLRQLGALFRLKPLIMHNGKSDVAGMYPTMGHTNLAYDTMLEHYVLDERRGGHGLGILGIELLGTPDWKSWVKPHLKKGAAKNFEDIPTDLLYRYNGVDCSVTYDLHAMFWPQLQAQGRDRLATFLVAAANQLVYLEMDGIGFDMPYSLDLTEQLQDEISQNEGRIQELLCLENPLNPRSPKQLLELFGDRGWKIPAKKGKATTGMPELTRARDDGWYDGDQTALDFLTLLAENRDLSKDDGTFVRGLQKRATQNDDGYRIHTTYTLHVTTTGRLSSKDPNLQNIKDKDYLRRQFVAAPGNVFLQGDYSQVEGRVIAVLSGDPYLQSLFLDADRDIFDELSVSMYGKLIKEKRRLLKTFFYGVAYERTEHGISKGFGIPLSEAKSQLDAFKSLIPGVIEWQEATWQQVQDQGYLETTFGRRRHFPLITNANKDEVRREAMAFKPQSTASDICLTAFADMRPQLEINYGNEGRTRLTIHDAIVNEVIAARELEMREDMRFFMELSGNNWAREQGSDVPFVVAFKSGTSWDQLG